uniref:Gustatory receptor n=1 Tax=Tetranychus urticae TaxID=32264 RepID=T1L296_TETUR
MIEMIFKLKPSNLPRYLKSFAYKLIGWTGESDIETRIALARFDYLNQLFLVSLNGGQKQEYDKPITRRVWIANWIARISVIYTVIRMTIFIYYQGNDEIDLYLANLIPEDVQPMKTSFLILTNITFSVLFMLREYIHYIERAGYLISFRFFLDFRIHGVFYERLNLTKRCSQLFNKICHLFMINGMRLLIGSCVGIFAIAIAFRLYFPRTYATKLHVLFVILHIPIETIATMTLFSPLINIGVYLWTFAALTTARMDSIIDRIKYCLDDSNLSLSELRQINLQVIQVFNYIDKSSSHLNYLLLFLDGLIAIEADIMLLFALIYKLFPDVISKIISFGGITIHFFLVIGTYWASNYYVKVLSVHGYYTKLILNTQTICSPRLKALEIQDRITMNQTGIKIGDFGLITPELALLFILENINFIMLLTCNINSLVETS